MLKEGNKILVHIFDCSGREVSTRNCGKVFEVKKINGFLGIDWNTEKSPYFCRGDVFNPFYTFANNVIFEDVESGKKYHYSDIANGIVEGC